MSSKRQQTMAKLTRERLVKERRALKLERKKAAAAERDAKATAGTTPEETVVGAEGTPDAPVDPPRGTPEGS